MSSAIIGTKRGHRYLAPELITVLLITDDFAGGIRLAFDQSLLERPEKNAGWWQTRIREPRHRLAGQNSLAQLLRAERVLW